MKNLGGPWGLKTIQKVEGVAPNFFEFVLKRRARQAGSPGPGHRISHPPQNRTKPETPPGFSECVFSKTIARLRLNPPQRGVIVY